MIAAIGEGWFNSADEAIETWVHYKSAVFSPNAANVKRYEAIYEIWQKAYGDTKRMTHELQKIIQK